MKESCNNCINYNPETVNAGMCGNIGSVESTDYCEDYVEDN